MAAWNGPLIVSGSLDEVTTFVCGKGSSCERGRVILRTRNRQGVILRTRNRGRGHIEDEE